MSREQVINYLRSFGMSVEQIQAVERAFTCEDAISRQAVLDLAYTIETDDYSGNEIVDVVEIEDIKQLPPVKPTYTDAEE